MLTRRNFVSGAAAAATAALLARPAIGQSTRKMTLRFVPEENLSVLDPIFSTVTSTEVHGWHIYDTLYGMDSQFRMKPQMAEGHTVSGDGLSWEFKLREGLKFHDGERVRALDCATSMLRWSQRDAFGQQVASAIDAWEAPDDRTLRVRLKRPYPRLLEAIARPSSTGPFIMPDRIAQTDPFKPIAEAIGSGPFRFLPSEYVSGSRVAYERFDGYLPRNEAADYTSGGKIANFQRVEWQVMPDSATAASALRNGEVDWIEGVDNDMLPILESDARVKVAIKDPGGRVAYIRFNVLNAPFNKAAVRNAVLRSLTQIDYLSALSGGDPTLYRECYSMFPCGFPLVGEIAPNVWKRGAADYETQKNELKKAGYNGERIVILSAADIQFIKTMAEITADTLKKVGMNVDLQTMDWGTLAQRRASKEPVENGGWSIFPTAWPSVNVANPAINELTRGVGQAGFMGWFDSPEMEERTANYVHANSDSEQQNAFDAVQQLAFDQAPSAPVGMFYEKTAFGKDIEGFLPGCWAFPWNLRRV